MAIYLCHAQTIPPAKKRQGRTPPGRNDENRPFWEVCLGEVVVCLGGSKEKFCAMKTRAEFCPLSKC